MATTLSDGATTVALDDDLFWSDENSWSPVEQVVDPSITGALIVQAAARVSARSITLEAPDDNSAWMKRSVVDQLRTWAAIPGKVLTLTLRGVAHTVIFRHHEKPAFQDRPVVQYSDIDAEDNYLCTLKFMEIS